MSQHDQERDLPHVDTLEGCGQQATGGQNALIPTAVVRDLLLYLDDTDAHGQFEAIADRFYQATGWLRPGKSVPLAMAEKYQSNHREVAWREWVTGWRAELIAALTAGVPAAREGCDSGSVSTVNEGENRAVFDPPESAISESPR